ncbi:androgen-induced gene 1 protein-like isoform X3 [Periplaneta americana]|uniref:androgen-induced gene 1 protein-like isoform X3 n=1 Tax=Periplaneta americana TaxID=6978 RepID=UPI0037E90B2B
MLRHVYYIIAIVHFYYGIYYAVRYLRLPAHLQRGEWFESIGRFKFLTFWNMILQSVYFTICLINDFFGNNDISIKEKPLIRKLKDYMYATVAFPLAMFVGVQFWALMAIDRELVFPKALDPFFPSWLNHVMHTNIVIFTVLEMVTTFRVYPKRSKGLTGLLVFLAVYLVWLHIIYANSGVWVYPVLEVLNWWQRVIFYIVSLCIACGLYLIGETLNKAIWGKVQKQLEAGKGRKKTK